MKWYYTSAKGRLLSDASPPQSSAKLGPLGSSPAPGAFIACGARCVNEPTIAGAGSATGAGYNTGASVHLAQAAGVLRMAWRKCLQWTLRGFGKNIGGNVEFKRRKRTFARQQNTVSRNRKCQAELPLSWWFALRFERKRGWTHRAIPRRFRRDISSFIGYIRRRL